MSGDNCPHIRPDLLRSFLCACPVTLLTCAIGASKIRPPTSGLFLCLKGGGGMTPFQFPAPPGRHSASGCERDRKPQRSPLLQQPGFEDLSGAPRAAPPLWRYEILSGTKKAVKTVSSTQAPRPLAGTRFIDSLNGFPLMDSPPAQQPKPLTGCHRIAGTSNVPPK
jgi:hypothetical protein